MTTPRALWLPFEVDDLDSLKRFYRDLLGLPEVDSWTTPTERGTVLRITDGAYLELVSPGTSRAPVPLAIELAGRSEVEATFARLHGAPVVRPPGPYLRGHYGFEVRDPSGTHIMVWHEKPT
ncbi:VOC family protein [Actinokineospora auranticolor]|uniref:Glyoxalase/bleomycin resistance protein/dioxygenase superfamily protein n=1 Tax=Actinokineospora auranticolor TaxID=155976 RepID=A0A2S6GCT0_9PSEU|nr:VOC family protein [Actinokineospora auranticolor]PPK62401.1 glyoxalase/bleomycin resistance protein/dioxygenase superfamily protein [Actinokineospora auranticolor]